MRLLLVIPRLHGGSGQYCRLLAEGLERCCEGSVAPSLLVWDAEGLRPDDAARFERIETLGRRAHADWRRAFEPLLFARPLRAAVRRLAPDVILTVGMYANLVVPRACGKIPALLSEHVHVSQRSKFSRYGPALRRAAGRGYRGRTVVVPSQGVADDLRRLGATDVRVIPHGIDAEHVRAAATEPVPDDLPAGPFALAVGRLDVQKNYPLLLGAFARARAAGVRHHLVVLGEGDDLENLQSLAKSLGVAESVRFLGRRDNPFGYMRRAAFLVSCSKWEGFGLVLPEAMCLGTPCVSTDSPSGPAEILDHGRYGLITPTDDEIALGRAMEEMADPATRDRYSRLSEQRAREYTIERMGAAYERLLRAM